MTRLQATARRLKMTQLCISQCNFSSLGAIILKITEIKWGRTNYQVFHHLISCTKPIQRHATAFLTGSNVLGWGIFTVRVPQEATDALEVESGGERGETVTAALQTQNDRRSLQLHLDQLYPQQRKHWPPLITIQQQHCAAASQEMPSRHRTILHSFAGSANLRLCFKAKGMEFDYAAWAKN